MSHRTRIATVALLVAAGIAFSSRGVMAQTASTTFDVTANVAKSCTVSVPALSFGAYDPGTGLAVTGTTALTMRCTRSVVAAISLNDGSNSIAVNTRRMASAGEFLTYDLYQDAPMNVRWGSNGQARSWTAPNSGNNLLTVYGRIDSGQDVASGAFSDQIQVTVNY